MAKFANWDRDVRDWQALARSTQEREALLSGFKCFCCRDTGTIHAGAVKEYLIDNYDPMIDPPLRCFNCSSLYIEVEIPAKGSNNDRRFRGDGGDDEEATKAQTKELPRYAVWTLDGRADHEVCGKIHEAEKKRVMERRQWDWVNNASHTIQPPTQPGEVRAAMADLTGGRPNSDQEAKRAAQLQKVAESLGL